MVDVTSGVGRQWDSADPAVGAMLLLQHVQSF